MYAPRSDLTKRIFGESGGAPMAGVCSCPLSTAQRVYGDDFQQINAGLLAHPYSNITSNHSGSTPYNLITGTAYVPSAYKAGIIDSEYGRQFNKGAWMGYHVPRAKWASGGRVEQLCKLS